MSMLPDGFGRAERDGLLIVHRRDVGEWLEPLLGAAPYAFRDANATLLAGGRGATYRVERAGHCVVVRGGRRGGLPGRLVRETYFGWRPRVLEELAIVERLRRAGVPVAVALGAVVEWRWPLRYRMWMATEWVENVGTLWSWLCQAHDEPRRVDVLRAAGRAVRAMHDAGVAHADLNLNNFLVCEDEQRPIVLIDFDRARGVERGVATLEHLLGRLRRSAARLDPTGLRVKASDYDAVVAGYEGRDG